MPLVFELDPDWPTPATAGQTQLAATGESS